MKKWMKFAVAGAAIAGVIIYLLATGINNYSVYYLKVSELIANPHLYENKGTRLSGDVVEGTIYKDKLNPKLLRFDIADKDGSKMKVEYNGVVPDAFEEGVEVIVEGKYDVAKAMFLAKRLLAKCPSKYEGADPAEHNAAIASTK